PRECSLQIVDVTLDRRVTHISHRARAGETVHTRAAAARLRAAHAAVFRIKLGELLALLAAERPCAAPLLGDRLAKLEPRKAVVHVGPPGAVIDGPAHRLAELAVIDDVDAALRLTADNVSNRRPQPRLQRGVRRIVAIELEQIVRPRQAADM